MILGGDILKFDAGCSGKFRVASEHGYAPSDNIRHPLARPMIGRKELKVFQPVICFIARNVVNRLILVKRAAQVLLHNPTMLKHFVSGNAVFCGEANNDVSALGAPGNFSKPMPLSVEFASPLISARLAAKVLFSVKSVTGWPAFARKCFSAIAACQSMSRVSLSSLGSARAFCGTVKRVFIELLSIRRQISWLVRKSCSALPAGEGDFTDPRGWPSMDRFMSGLAHSFAKASRCFSLSRNYEGLTALLANFGLNRHFALHGGMSIQVTKGVY